MLVFCFYFHVLPHTALEKDFTIKKHEAIFLLLRTSLPFMGLKAAMFGYAA